MVLIRYAVFCLLLTGCASSRMNNTNNTDVNVRARKLKESEPLGFHKAIELTIGWYPYEEGKAIKLDSEHSAVSFDDSSRTGGIVPVIYVSYPDSGQSLTLEMGIDNALLGKLLKHSLMTEIPIRRPFTDFLKEADCAQCHPPEIELHE